MSQPRACRAPQTCRMIGSCLYECAPVEAQVAAPVKAQVSEPTSTPRPKARLKPQRAQKPPRRASQAEHDERHARNADAARKRQAGFKRRPRRGLGVELGHADPEAVRAIVALDRSLSPALRACALILPTPAELRARFDRRQDLAAAFATGTAA